MTEKKVIALDGDGVLLDYHAAYQLAWGKAFGAIPSIRDANAYWPIDRYDVRELSGDDLAHFRRFFNESFWSTVPPIEDAVEACRLLIEYGYELVCVTALDHRYQFARQQNLHDHGFPINRVVTTASDFVGVSPKALALVGLKAVAFVDDYLPYFRGLPGTMHRALILREPNGSPNVGDDLALVDSTHGCLGDFVNHWVN